MKLHCIKTLVAISILTSALSLAVKADKLPAAEPLTAHRSILATVTATVQAIDLKKREMTLKGPLGNEVTLTVDEQVKRLNEVKAGDHVSVDYYISVSGELRPPTDEEKKHPLQIMHGLAKAPAGTDPAGGGLHIIKAVMTIDGLHLPSRTVTLKGPLHNYVEVEVADLNNLEKLHLGETVVVTYTEALVVSLEKIPSQKTK